MAFYCKKWGAVIKTKDKITTHWSQWVPIIQLSLFPLRPMRLNLLDTIKFSQAVWLELGKVLFGISCQIGCINNSYNNRLDLSDNNQFMSSGPCNQHSVSSNKFHHKNKIFEKQQKHTNQTKIFKEVFSGSVMRFSYLKKRCQITRLSIIHKKRICSQK